MEPSGQQGLQRTAKSWGSGLHLGGLADGGAPAAWNSALPRGPVAEVLRPSAGGAVLVRADPDLGGGAGWPCQGDPGPPGALRRATPGGRPFGG